MDRNKVLELAREAELARQFALEVPFVVDRLERFAALIELEVRGDAEPVASVHIKDGCLIGSQRKSDADFPDGQYGLYPIGTFPASAVDAEPVACIATNGALMWLKRPEALYSKPVPLFSHPAPAVAKTAFVHLPQDPDRFIALQSGDRLTVEARNPAPAVVRQLVEALETLVGWEEAEAAHFEAEGPDDWIMDKARKALAAVKGVQL